MKLTLLKWLSIVTCVVMFLALFGGGVVTRTDSGLGCGNEWPTCHGKLVPAHTLASVIEWSHRFVSALAGLLSLVSCIACTLYRNKVRFIQLYSILNLMFVTIQGALGAMAVVKPQSSPVMALHFGFALIAFASALMMMLSIIEKEKLSGSTRWIKKDTPISYRFRVLLYSTTVYSFIVVYTGAFLSRSNTASACRGFPLCNGQIIPNFSNGLTYALIHRAAAVILFVLIIILGSAAYNKYRADHQLWRLGITVICLCLLQVCCGIAMVFTFEQPEIYMFLVLLHMALISLLFGVLCYMSIKVLQYKK